MNYQEVITQQRIYIERKNDSLHGRHRMDYYGFCDAVDKLFPKEMQNYVDGVPVGNTRELSKAIAKQINREKGTRYYEIYLSIKYDQPL